MMLSAGQTGKAPFSPTLGEPEPIRSELLVMGKVKFQVFEFLFCFIHKDNLKEKGWEVKRFARFFSFFKLKGFYLLKGFF